MESNQLKNRIFNHKEFLYHLAPIPLVMHELKYTDLDSWHTQLKIDAKTSLEQNVIEVPDVRHIDDMGNPPHFSGQYWSEDHNPAIGVWHRVPTNQYLSLTTSAVTRLRETIEEFYIKGIHLTSGANVEKAYISESRIQFYLNSDYKVLHNHERYGPPYPTDAWAGAYYISDGEPDVNMPYSGVLSFRVRNENHFIRPRSGLLLIWPADILHEVHPFYGKEERIVINFNINSSQIIW